MDRFSCKECGKKFKDKAKLVRHGFVHSGERPFECPYCEKSFSIDFNLKTHIRIHTGEKPYKCFYCSLNFTQGGNRNLHMLTRHGVKYEEPPQPAKVELPEENRADSLWDLWS